MILAVTGTLWLRNTVDLLRFATAVLGRLPIITPVYVYAAMMALAGVMIVPPIMAVAAPERPLARPALVTALCLLTVAVATGAAALAPAYTSERPLRRHIRALQETDNRTIWEVASLEPGLDLGPDAPGGWTRQSNAVPASVPWGRFRDPFVFRATRHTARTGSGRRGRPDDQAVRGGQRGVGHDRSAPQEPGDLLRASRRRERH